MKLHQQYALRIAQISRVRSLKSMQPQEGRVMVFFLTSWDYSLQATDSLFMRAEKIILIEKQLFPAGLVMIHLCELRIYVYRWIFSRSCGRAILVVHCICVHDTIIDFIMGDILRLG